MPASPPIAHRDPQRRDPVSGQPLPPLVYTSAEECEAKIHRALAAFPLWSQRPLEARLACIQTLRTLLVTRKGELANRITGEVGKPIAEAEREVEKIITLADYYRTSAADFLRDRVIPGATGPRTLRAAPLGPIVTISPGNFPLWQIIRAALPIILAGNVVLNKPAPLGDGSARALEELFREAGFPDGTFQAVQLRPDEAIALIQRAPVRGVSFTGGRAAGRAVGAAAGQALKPMVLELGGNDPAIILDDADLGSAVEQCVRARLYNNGQTCLGPKRLIVSRSVYHQVLEQARVLAEGLPHGHPHEPHIARGPLCSFEARTRLHAQIAASLHEGATLVAGGQLPAGSGAYYPATILADVPRESIAYRDELFGPVIALTAADSDEEAIALANATPFGLGASIFTASNHRAHTIAAQLEVANIGWNRIPRSGPEFPFGGIKESGFGRELGEAGLLAFTNQQVLAGFSDAPAFL